MRPSSRCARRAMKTASGSKAPEAAPVKMVTQLAVAPKPVRAVTVRIETRAPEIPVISVILRPVIAVVVGGIIIVVIAVISGLNATSQNDQDENREP